MEVSSKLFQDTLYMSLVGELDQHTASYVREAMDTQMKSNNFNQIIIDLSKLDFMDSTGIGVLIGRYKKMKANQVPIFISNPSKQADKIFQMTALYQVMPKLD